MHGMMAGYKCKGIMMLVLGVLFLLGTTDVWPEFTFMKYWPLFLILWGLHDALCKCMNGGEKGGMCGCK